MTEQFHETVLIEAGDIDEDGSFPVRFITEGWGSSGHYSAPVLEAAVGLFAEGTPMFLDHATASEKLERPIRSVKDIAATITEAGKYNPT
ncbi:MAG: hypothetical protein JWQ74_461, partial [Marmoricola sp.]|nr:hypothetical protein [Marmoricola sp.]